MKKLILAALLALAVSARAQSTNITLTLNVREPTRTNDMTRELSQKEIRGLTVNWEKDIMLANQLTNAAPSFRKSVLDWHLNEYVLLQRIADADKARRAKMKEFADVILNDYDRLSGAQQAQIDTIVAALGL